MKRTFAMLLTLAALGLTAFGVMAMAGCNGDEDAVATGTAPGPTSQAGFVNEYCPIMGNPVAADTPAELTREYNGETVAFCCAMCPDRWDAMTAGQKAEALANAGYEE